MPNKPFEADAPNGGAPLKGGVETVGKLWNRSIFELLKQHLESAVANNFSCQTR